LPIRDAIAQAAALGAEAVELDARNEIKPREMSETAVRQLRKLLEDHRLRVAAVSFRTRRGYHVTEDLNQRVEATKDALTLAYQLGAGVVVNSVGHIPPEAQGREWETLRDALTDLGRHGQRAGALLAARTGAESGADLARLIRALPEGSLGVDFDPGSLIVAGFSPAEALAALASNVVHVHATDGVRDLGQGRGVQTPLGEGAVDFPQLLGSLEEQDYRGYFTLERESSAEPLREIREAVKFLRGL
jgi:sugar phosphate isomerase/epimerase